MKQHLNHTIGIILVLPLLLFFFYKSIFSSHALDDLPALISELETAQFRLQHDLLSLRNDPFGPDDALNTAARQLVDLERAIVSAAPAGRDDALSAQLAKLARSVETQAGLIEEFRTSNPVLQNSLDQFFSLHTELLSDNVGGKDGIPAGLPGRIATLILEYSRKPEQATALKILPLLDKLSAAPNSDFDTLVEHSQIIIDKLPVIDGIIANLAKLNIEHQVNQLEQMLAQHRAEQDQHTRIYNTLLFFSSLYLLSYIGYMVLILKQNQKTLLLSNEKLNREVEKRAITEKTLYRLVKETSSIDDKDFVRNILYALYKALGYRYTYVSLVSGHSNNEATMLGLIDNGKYQADVAYKLVNTPCEEVLSSNRLVHNRDFRNYFPDWENNYLSSAESYIGITIKDQDDSVVGLIAVADDKPINNSNLAEHILSLAASRTSAELLRNNALKDSRRYHAGLETIDSWLLKLINCGGDTEEFYRTVCQAAMDIGNASMTAVPLLDQPGETYVFAATAGRNSEQLAGTSHALSNGGLCGWVIANKTPVRIDDVSSDVRARRELIARYQVRSACVVPIYHENDIYGAIAVFRDKMPFDTIDAQLISQFSQRVQLAIANMQLVHGIAAEKERAEFTLRSIGDAVITTDANGRIEYMNHIAEQLTGWQLDTVYQTPVQHVFRILDHDTREPMHHIIDACLGEGTTTSKSTTCLVNHNGSEHSIENSMSPITGHDGSIEGAVIVFHDETERKRMECIIHQQATHDPLTGLINRHQFHRELKVLIDQARNHDTRHVLCLIDLDRFKIVNDSCGHAAGDELLKQVASSLHTTIRSGDILGRLGGDEFGLILQNCPVDMAREIAENIILAVSESEFLWDGNRLKTSVSIGIVPISAQTDSIQEAVKHADVACYTAKEQGCNQAYIYNRQDTELIKRQDELHWASRISQALDQDRFKIHAQSILALDPAAARTRHIEILVRMEDENGNLIPPASFIPAAERYELMGAVDQHIIRETFRFIAGNDCDGIQFSINLSGSSLNDDNLGNFIKQCRKEYTLAAESICFEIAESTAIGNLTNTRRLIEDLQREGFEFALDDFGKRLSSFSYLENLPVDYLKIDGSFVREMVDSKTDHAMVAAINQIGHILEIRTIAEFVENIDIIEQLHDLGVDYAQGYGISKPKPLTPSTLQDMISQTVLNDSHVSAS